MQVLWWLVPPILATALAMVWVAVAGRSRDELRRDDSDEALARMQKALARPTPGGSVTASVSEHSHGVAMRRARAGSGTDAGSAGRR